MSLNFIKEGANGQLEIDFESLEALTSKKLVEALQEELGTDSSKIVNIEVVSLVEDDNLVSKSVYVVTKKFGYYFSWDLRKETKKETVRSTWMHLGIMKDLLKLRGDE